MLGPHLFVVGLLVHVIGIGESEEKVETLTVGAEGLGVAQVPLSNRSAGVARGREHLGDSDLVGIESRLFGREEHIRNPGPDGISSGQDRRAGRTAEGGCGVEIGEADSLGSHPVETRRADLLRAVATQIAVTEVVGENYDEVRGPVRGRFRLLSPAADAYSAGEREVQG